MTKTVDESKRRSLKTIGLGLAGLILNPSMFFAKGETLEEIMAIAQKPVGSRIATQYFDVYSKNGSKTFRINLLLDRPDKETLRIGAYPVDWKKDVVIQSIDVYLVSPHKSRFEFDESFVFWNKLKDIVNYTDPDTEYSEGGEKILDKSVGLVFDVLSKIGINKTQIVGILEALDPAVFPDPTATSEEKQKAIEAGNLHVKGPVYCTKKSFNGEKYIDLLTRCDTKFYDLRIKEGEKSIAVLMVSGVLIEYKDLVLAGPGFSTKRGYRIIQVDPSLYGKKKDWD